MQIDIIKGHGSGNDFLLIDEISNDYVFTEEDRANLAKILCNRDADLGADGILFIMKSEQVDGRMRVFNADGSEASMCGNGLRLVARYICELKGINQAVIETMKANLKVRKQEDIFPHVHTYQVEISPVLFELKALPLNLNKPTLFNERIKELSDELRFTALAVPNPHLIAMVETEQLDSNLQKQLSEKVNGPNDLFPDGVNVSFVKPLERGSIYVRTFERGVGFTNACGTAMSASSLVTCLTDLNDFETAINVYNNGGKVQCVVHKTEDSFTIDLIGNATYLYRAFIELSLNEKTFSVSSKTNFTEQDTYEKLQVAAQEKIEQSL
ncbi:diaminopimelate epimerase [Neobacillus drentensis]|uniref:diaminopimelate epimerase n=1 Tax=Neobacillus drentensis TaxID=220684 RepID=UPI001F44AE83|nr:diaminopimelate epimerase [Neobacillus drentensis]ULT55285.1 diaminopimelate epimerase [Neobacillus drentensis]